MDDHKPYTMLFYLAHVAICMYIYIYVYLEPRKRANIFLFQNYVLFCETALFLAASTFEDGRTDFSETDTLHGSYCPNGPSELQRVLPDFVCALLRCLVLSISSV